MNGLFQFFIGTGGGKSSKRLFLFMLMVLWATYVIANLFWGKVLKDSLEENLFYLIVVMFAGVTAEPLTRKRGGLITTQTNDDGTGGTNPPPDKERPDKP